jgi:NAD-dependent deacetylase
MLERAGCHDVIHLHGTLTDLRCEDCGAVFEIGYDSQKGVVCPKCESDHIRHNVVMFGEAAPMYRYLYELQNEADMLVVIGTSGQVIDVAYLAQLTPYSVLNNLDRDGYIEEYFTKVYIDKATNAIDQIIKDIEEFLNE